MIKTSINDAHVMCQNLFGTEETLFITTDLVMTSADFKADEALKMARDRLDQGDDPNTSGVKYGE
jgi:hypothetical protein